MNGDWVRVPSILHVYLTQNYSFDEPFVDRTKELSVCFEETVAAFVLFRIHCVVVNVIGIV